MKVIYAAALATLASAAAHAAGPADPMAPISQFIDGFNTGNTASAYAAFAPGPVSVIDEFAPHVWIGTDAMQRWSADYGTNATAEGVTDGSVKLGAPSRQVVENATAYVIVPATYTYKSHGTPTSEEAPMAFSLVRAEGGWKIRAWSWTGTNPHPVH